MSIWLKSSILASLLTLAALNQEGVYPSGIEIKTLPPNERRDDGDMKRTVVDRRTVKGASVGSPGNREA